MHHLWRVWGKTSNLGGTPDYHPLLCHLLDTGHVAQQVLGLQGAAVWRTRLADALGVDEKTACRVVPFLLALHDLGKCSPGFQSKSPQHWPDGLPHGPDLPGGQPFDHDRESLCYLSGLLEREKWLAPPKGVRPRSFYLSLAQAVGAHHGRFFGSARGGGYPQIPVEPDPSEPWQDPWRQLRSELARYVADYFLGAPVALQIRNLSVMCVLLNGMAILCDWLASDEQAFPLYGDGDPAAYPGISKQRAAAAVAQRQLFEVLPATPNPTFRALFPQQGQPRPIQAALEQVPLCPPSLIIVEAPTGEGKTEAALLLVARCAGHGSAAGFYFALPTVATSNQMYDRVREFLAAHAGGRNVALHLVNGQAEWSEHFGQRLEEIRTQAPRDAHDPVLVDVWALPRKRSLLVPYGVGTVDQAMLAALNTRHGALRLLGLSGKVVIIDEIHAYDAYMSTILVRLLEWLRAIGTTVILLSATLPAAKRQELLNAYAGCCVALQPEETEAYPLITMVRAGSGEPPKCLKPERGSRSLRIRLAFRNDGAGARTANAAALLGRIRAGGCAAWIVNTVAEAQECYQAVRALVDRVPEPQRPEVILFHSRFLLAHRRDIERRVLSLFGPPHPDQAPPPARPPAILIATQVVEQSLDLDFDWMWTQVAPIDLLIQRAGRLHRHVRGRPDAFREAELVLLMPEQRDGHPQFHATALIYEPFLLLKTLLALHGRDEITVPDQVRELIEAVYDGVNPAREVWTQAGLDPSFAERAEKELERHLEEYRAEARQRLLGRPLEKGGFVADTDLPFDEEAAERSAFLASQTRLSEPSVSALLIEEGDPLLSAASASNIARDSLRRLMDRFVRIADRDLVEHVADCAPGITNCVHPALRGVVCIPVRNGQYSWTRGNARCTLQVSAELGVTIIKNKEETLS